MDFSRYVYYSTTSNTGLRWRETRYAGNDGHIPIVIKDSIAGSVTKSGHYEVSINGKSYYCHRIIWELFGNNLVTGMVIDHIDGDGLNNTIENIRLIEHKVNIRNSKMNSNNTSGTKGVCRITRKDNFGNTTYAWKASWLDLWGTEHSASFAENKYGAEKAKELAVQARILAIKSLNDNGAGYTERHIYGN